MGFISSLTALVNGPFRYRAGPDRLGIGEENLALEQPGRADDMNFYSPRYNIQRGMNVSFPALVPEGQFLPAYDLRANGVYLAGSLELQSLIDDYNNKA